MQVTETGDVWKTLKNMKAKKQGKWENKRKKVEGVHKKTGQKNMDGKMKSEQLDQT